MSDIDSALLEVLLESSHDHLVITDAAGCILHASPGACAVYGVSMQTLRSTSAQVLEARGVFSPSVTTRVLASGASAQVMQTTLTGRQVLAEAHPIFVHGELVRVVSRSRDMTDLQLLQEEYALLSNRLNDQLRRSDPDTLTRTLGLEEFEVRSRGMQDAVALLKRVAGAHVTVLLTGESGVGKTALARQVHCWSERREGPFVDVNCSAIPESLFESEVFGYAPGAFSGASRRGKPGLMEQAEGGTLFLDEIAELPLSVQAKLLKVLQDGMVMRLGDTLPRRLDFRLVVATNQALERRVEEGAFRLDLYYRLNVVPVHLPPLRERREDIPALVERQMRRLNERYGITRVVDERLWAQLMSHDWPGNVRELENFLERSWLTSDMDAVGDEWEKGCRLTPPKEAEVSNVASETPTENDTFNLAATLLHTERELLERAVRGASSTYELARRLGISQPGAVRKLKKHGLRLSSR